MSVCLTASPILFLYKYAYLVSKPDPAVEWVHLHTSLFVGPAVAYVFEEEYEGMDGFEGVERRGI
jgi:hypothetical protein